LLGISTLYIKFPKMLSDPVSHKIPHPTSISSAPDTEIHI